MCLESKKVRERKKEEGEEGWGLCMCVQEHTQECTISCKETFYWIRSPPLSTHWTLITSVYHIAGYSFNIWTWEAYKHSVDNSWWASAHQALPKIPGPKDNKEVATVLGHTKGGHRLSRMRGTSLMLGKILGLTKPGTGWCSEHCYPKGSCSSEIHPPVSFLG
jgi:hypothetical protein